VQLGCAGQSVQLHLSKLVVHTEGHSVPKHRGVKKQDGMWVHRAKRQYKRTHVLNLFSGRFATVMIQLPSVFEGGEIVAYQNGVARTCDLGTPEV
jgi:hypothetical protein